jgi:hypothetical protein
MPSLYSDKLDPSRWEIDGSGFLRIRTRVLSSGVMAYSREEIGEANIPPEIKDNPILLVVMPDTLAEPRAIRSLEGMPITVQHAEINVQNTEAQVGSVAGTPCVEGPYLCADMRITDVAAIAQVASRELVELSSAYQMEVLWERGEYDGAPFHGKQTKLRYEHVALLPQGEGRAGPDVRVLNRQTLLEDTTMADPVSKTLIKIGNRQFSVENAQAAEIANAVDEQVSEAKKTTSTAFNAQLEEIAGKLKEATDAKAAQDKIVADLQGQLAQMKEQLDAVSSPAAIEDKANAMNAERDEAATVMNSKTLAPELKKLTGHALRVAVINSVRAVNKQPALTADELKDEPGIKGRYSVMVENAKATPGARKEVPVTGASTIKVENSNDGAAQKPVNYATERFSKLYPEPKAVASK